MRVERCRRGHTWTTGGSEPHVGHASSTTHGHLSHVWMTVGGRRPVNHKTKRTRNGFLLKNVLVFTQKVPRKVFALRNLPIVTKERLHTGICWILIHLLWRDRCFLTLDFKSCHLILFV